MKLFDFVDCNCYLRKRQLTFSLQLKLQLFASCIYQFVGR